MLEEEFFDFDHAFFREGDGSRFFVFFEAIFVELFYEFSHGKVELVAFVCGS